MAAYQPFHLPYGIGVNRGLESLTDSMRGLADFNRQQRVDQDQRERQQRTDFQAAYLLAHKLAAAGDFEGARAALAPFKTGAQVVREEVPGMPKPMAGGGAMPDQIEFDPGARMRTPDEVQRARAGGHDIYGGDAQQVAPMMDDKDTVDYMAGTEAPAPQSPTNPLLALAAKNRANEQEQMAKYYRMVLRGTDPSGNQFSIDPDAARRARIERMDTAFGQGDEMTREIYAQLRPSLAASNEDIDPGEVFRFITAEKQMRAKAAADAADEQRRAQQKLADEERARQEWNRRNEITSKQSDARSARAAAIMAGREGKKEGERLYELEVPDLDGNPVGRARTVVEAQKMREGQAAVTAIGGVTARLAKFVEANGTFQIPLLEAGTKKELEGLLSEAAGWLTQARMSGTLTQGEFERYSSMLSPSALQDRESAIRNIQQVNIGLREAYQAKLKSQMIGGGSAAPAAGGKRATPDQDARLKKPNPIIRARAHEAARNIFEGKEE